MVGLTKAVPREVGEYGITVNSYCPQANSPGHIREFNKTIRKIVAAQGEDARPPKEKLDAVEQAHGDAYDLAPFLAWLCTDEAAHVSGSVFGVTGSGRIERYSEPEIVAKIQAKDGPWTVEQLTKTLPDTLLAGYRSEVFTDERKNKKEAGDISGREFQPLFPKGNV